MMQSWSYRLHNGVDEHERWPGVGVTGQPGCVKLQQELEAGVDVQAAQGDGSLLGLDGRQWNVGSHLLLERTVHGVRRVGLGHVGFKCPHH